jgi:hypothetical protein
MTCGVCGVGPPLGWVCDVCRGWASAGGVIRVRVIALDGRAVAHVLYEPNPARLLLWMN